MILCSGPNCQTTVGCQCQGVFDRVQITSDRPITVHRIETAQSRAYAAGRLAGLREAAEVARGSKSYDDNLQKSAGCYTAGERIAAALLALAEGKEG